MSGSTHYCEKHNHIKISEPEGWKDLTGEPCEPFIKGVIQHYQHNSDHKHNCKGKGCGQNPIELETLTIYFSKCPLCLEEENQ